MPLMAFDALWTPSRREGQDDLLNCKRAQTGVEEPDVHFAGEVSFFLGLL